MDRRVIRLPRGVRVVSPIYRVMGTAMAAEKWGYSESHVKDMCRNGDVEAIQIGKTYLIAKNHPNPKEDKNHGKRKRRAI